MQELSKELECFLEQSGMKLSALARAIGASASLISQIKSASYKGDVALWSKKIRDFIANVGGKIKFPFGKIKLP